MKKTVLRYLAMLFSIAAGILLWESMRGLFAQTTLKELLGDLQFYLGLAFLIAAVIVTNMDLNRRNLPRL